MFEKILIAVDGSEPSNHAMEMAIEMAKKFGSELHMLHVVRSMQLPTNFGRLEDYVALERRRHDLLKSAGEQILNQCRGVAEAAGLSTVKTDVGAGDPANAIVTYANKNGIDLIALGSRGLGEVEGVLMGSVSRKVSNTSKSSCLIFK